jgi:hypothetical protein
MLRAALVPAHTIPLPGLLHRLWATKFPMLPTSRRAPIHDHHLAIGVVGHALRQALERCGNGCQRCCACSPLLKAITNVKRIEGRSFNMVQRVDSKMEEGEGRGV